MNFHAVPARIFEFAYVSMGRDDRWTENNAHFIPVGRDDEGRYFRSETDHQFEVFMTHQEVYEKLTSKKASVSYNWHHPGNVKLRAIFGNDLNPDIKPEKKMLAEFRQKLIERYDRYILKHGKSRWSKAKLFRKLNVWAEEINTAEIAAGANFPANKPVTVTVFKVPSVKTFQRNHKFYHFCDENVLALVPRHHGPGKKLHTLTPHAIAFARTEARGFLSRQKPKYAQVYRDYEAALKKENGKREQKLLKVSRKKFVAMIKRFDKFEVHAARHGVPAAIRFFRKTMRNHDVKVPGQRIELDHLKVDLMSLIVETGFWDALPKELQDEIQDQRIWFVAAIDVATRYILSFRASVNPNAASTVSAIRQIMSDKTFLSEMVGAQTPWFARLRPKEIFMDNGTENIAERVANVLILARIGKSTPEAGDPQGRPFIESLFHSIGPLVAPYFDGYTFNSVAAKGDLDPADFQSLIADELIKIFIFAVCDVYHRKPHEGLGGNTPHNAMVQALKEYEIDAPPSDAEMFMIFGLPQKRALQSDGVVNMGIQYNSDRLQRLRTKAGLQEIEIMVDTECAGFVAAEDEDGWFLVRNLCGLDETITLWEWMAARNARLKANAIDTADDKDVYLSGLSLLRETGESARLRAGLAHRALNAKQLDELNRELFGEWTASVVETGYVYDPGDVVMPADPLLRPRLPAGVIARPLVGGLIPESEATAKQLAATQRHPDHESVVNQAEEEFERSPFAEEDED